MSEIQLTDREQEYLSCDIPNLSGGRAAVRLVVGVFASMLQAVFRPSSDPGKADRDLMRTVREIRYTRYRHAVQHKLSGSLSPRDQRLLKRLNSRPFVLEAETYDPDAFTTQIYEEYMAKQEKNKS